MMMQCPECGKEISDKAASCPHCGAPASAWADGGEAKQKKKRIWIPVCAAVLLILAALAWFGRDTIGGVFSARKVTETEPPFHTVDPNSPPGSEKYRVTPAQNSFEDDAEEIFETLKESYGDGFSCYWTTKGNQFQFVLRAKDLSSDELKRAYANDPKGSQENMDDLAGIVQRSCSWAGISFLSHGHYDYQVVFILVTSDGTQICKVVDGEITESISADDFQ